MSQLYRVSWVLLLVATCGWTATNALTCSTATYTATKSIKKACFNLFNAVLPGAATKPTYAISPASIIYALALATNGAGVKSTTQTELLRFLSASRSPLAEATLNKELQRILNGVCGAAGDKSQLILANSIWTKQAGSINPAYASSMQTLFNATARVATNGARDINAWVEEITRGLIKDLIKDDNFLAVLANAVYFDAKWAEPFDEKNTLDGTFMSPFGPKTAFYMSKTFANLSRANKPGLYDAIALPYEGGRYTAVALLPNRNRTLAQVVRDWAAAPLTLKPLGAAKVVLPRFNATTDTGLKSVLTTLNITRAFLPGAANFSRMTNVSVFVSDVVHKVTVIVGENGTVAAAGTGVIMMGSSPLGPPLFSFDRPFAFIIQHNPTKLPLFAVVVNDPSPPSPPPAHRRLLRGSSIHG